MSETLSKVYEQDNAKVSFDVVNRWPDGYQVQVYINNLSESPIA